MKWGVYSRNAFLGGQVFAQGLQELGHEALLRSAPDWGNGCAEDFDAIALYGLQGKGATILQEYKDRGVPVIVIDYGYVKRTNYAHDWKTGHWQVSLNELNKIPDFECPSDRFDALGVKIAAKGGNAKGYTLLCIQTPSDMSHGMDSDQLKEWAHSLDYPNLVIRPHPLLEDADYDLPICEAKTLDEALAGAKLVVTASSNSGHDALLAGVPVIGTHNPVWAELSGDKLPSVDARRKYFNRVAYAQWTWEEMESGLCQRFIIDHVLTGVGPKIEKAPAKAPAKAARKTKKD